jgi:hypothetical protein
MMSKPCRGDIGKDAPGRIDRGYFQQRLCRPHSRAQLSCHPLTHSSRCGLLIYRPHLRAQNLLTHLLLRSNIKRRFILVLFNHNSD